MNRMDDLISRQAAIDALKVAYWDNNIQSAKDDPCVIDAMTDWAIRQIKALPSAERHGKWIKKYRGNYLCSVCGAWYRTTDDYGNIIDGEMRSNYCESCGAKMDEVTE